MAELKGRRIPVTGTDDPYWKLTQPGDYYGPVYGFSGDRPAVFYLLPVEGRVLAHVCSPPHVFTEEEDGSLTIRESILSRWGDETGDKSWHGYLTNGVWKEC